MPHFICTHPESSGRLPRPGTLDVDIGIAVGASSGQYGSLPMRASHFVYGEEDTNEGDDVMTLRQQIRQDVVTLGNQLRAAAA